MTTTPTTADAIGAALDEVAHLVSDAPGQLPQDAQIARTLLAYTSSCIQGAPSAVLLDALHRAGADVYAAHTIARALGGAALRLGAWLGSAEAGQGARNDTRLIDTTGKR